MPVRKVTEEEDKRNLARLYLKGHKGTDESEALHQVEKFLGMKKQRQDIIRENWEYDARQSHEPTPDLIPEKRRGIAGVVKYPIPRKPVPPPQPMTIEQQLEVALRRIAELETVVKKQEGIIQAQARELEKK